MEGEKCEKFYVIVRGSGTESTNNGVKQIRSVNHLIAMQNLLTNNEINYTSFKVNS